jgi:phosphatidate cytidylyltransferase
VISSKNWNPPEIKSIIKYSLVSLAMKYLGFIFITLGMEGCLLIYKAKGMSFFNLMLISAWQSDNGGLLFGKLFGKHKMSPNISPKKTYEGLCGAFVLS